MMTVKSKMQVLLIDDDPNVSWSIGRYLTKHGYAVSTCGDGLEAIQLLEKKDYSVVITDIQMPKVNGLALVEWMRKNRPRIHVIVMTAFGSPNIRDLCLRKGAILYLEKPLDPELLIDVLCSSNHEDTFTGSISQIDLFDYLQLMLVTRRQVVIEVNSREGEQGVIFIDRGDVQHAVCGDLQGEEAFFHSLFFEGGTFTTLPWRDPDKVSINERGDFMLMEAARRKDERSRDAGQPKPASSNVDDPDEDEELILA